MRLLTDFKDYYDGCFNVPDANDRGVFVRKKAKKLDILQIVHSTHPSFPFPRPDYHVLKGFDRTEKYFRVVCIAGKFFPFVYVHNWVRCGNDNKQIIWGKENYSSIFNHDSDRGFTSAYFGPTTPVMDWFDYWETPNVDSTFKMALSDQYGPVFGVFYKMHSELSGLDTGFRKMLGANSTPVGIEKNICLSAIGFQKVLPAFVTYNEIWKWLQNNQFPTRPIPEMPNDIKIHQAGFDLKKSFRKAKES
jgi:hypothetical protein